jgi:hypothetical protein
VIRMQRIVIGAFALALVGTTGCANKHGCCHRAPPPPAAPCCPEPAGMGAPPPTIMAPAPGPAPGTSYFGQAPSCNTPVS